MSELPHLKEIFDKLRNGYHLSPQDEPDFSAVVANHDAYAAYFAPLGLKLVRHPREFFYFEAEGSDPLAQTMPKVAVFAFILIDHAANLGLPIEEHLLGSHFLLSKLPHFSLDRYAALLRQVEVDDAGGLRQVVKTMERLGWAVFVNEDEFRFLRPFHRVFDKCLELSRAADADRTVAAAAATPAQS